MVSAMLIELLPHRAGRARGTGLDLYSIDEESALDDRCVYQAIAPTSAERTCPAVGPRGQPGQPGPDQGSTLTDANLPAALTPFCLWTHPGPAGNGRGLSRLEFTIGPETPRHRIAPEAQLREHLFQSGALGNVAGKHPGLHDESAGADDHRQGHQRTVAALLLRAPVPGQRVAVRPAFEAGAGQVVERHRRSDGEQAHSQVEQVPLDLVPVPRLTHVAERPEVDVRHLAQGAAFD